MRRISTVVLPAAVVLGIILWRAGGPQPQPPTAPAVVFSAERAALVLRHLLAEEVPHPIGSAANARVRDRILGRFGELGYTTDVQSRFACNSQAICGAVDNILARRLGRPGHDVVLVVAHYDSVAAGPGASDDGMGVAALLEIARAIRDDSFRNDVLFLITDGEEAGLLGAEAFVADEELARNVGVVVNVENRGTSGPSNLFETSTGNQWLIRLLSRSIRRPYTSSMYYEVYNRLPNDTDLTVFRRAGKAGVNFAAIGGVNRYHTPNDNLANANLRTMQHHGDNLLSMVRALADADLAARSRGDAVYFDVLGWFVLWWPQGWSLWVALASLALLVWSSRTPRSAPGVAPPAASTRGRFGLQPISLGVLGTFGAIVLSVVAGLGVSWVARAGSGGAAWVAHPVAAIASMWLTGVAAAALSYSFFARAASPRALLQGAAVVWHMIAIALILTIPGVSYLFLVPAVAITLASAVRTGEGVMAAIGTTAAAVVLFPVAVTIYDAMGGAMLPAIALLIGFTSTFAVPLFPRWRAAVGLLAIGLGAAAIAIALPPYTPDHPRHLSLAWVDDPASATPRWVAPALPDSLRAAARFEPSSPAVAVPPWSRARTWSAPAPRIEAPRVEMRASPSPGGLTITVVSPRGADRLALFVRGGKVVRVNETPLPPRSGRGIELRREGWEVAAVHARSEMRVEIAASGPVEAIASDVTFGLPEVGAALMTARDASPAVRIQDGDVTVTRARATFLAAVGR